MSVQFIDSSSQTQRHIHCKLTVIQPKPVFTDSEKIHITEESHSPILPFCCLLFFTERGIEREAQ